MKKILEGLRVVEMGFYAVAPWSAKHLGALGAEVIKLEPPEGEPSHHVAPYINKTAALYIAANLNKRHVALDLKDAGKRAAVLELIQGCDIFMENMRPGTCERLGFGYEALRKLNPRIIFASASAYGHSGEMVSQAGADPFVQAFCGWCSVTGAEGTEGEMLRYMAHLDLTTAAALTEAILQALVARERHGMGQRIECSMLSASISLQTTRLAEYLATGKQPRPAGSTGTLYAPDEAFVCQDRKYIVVSATTQEQWVALCTAIAMPGLAADARFAVNASRLANLSELRGLIAGTFKSKPLTWWLLKLKQNGVPRAANADFEGVRDSAQVRANGYLQDLATSHWGEVLVEGMPWKFDRTPAGPHRPGGLKGEHTDAVMAERTH